MDTFWVCAAALMFANIEAALISSTADYFLYNTDPQLSHIGYSLSMEDGVLAYGQHSLGYATLSVPDITSDSANVATNIEALSSKLVNRTELMIASTRNRNALFAARNAAVLFRHSPLTLSWAEDAQFNASAIYADADSWIIHSAAVDANTVVLSGTLQSVQRQPFAGIGVPYANKASAFVAVFSLINTPCTSTMYCIPASVHGDGFSWFRHQPLVFPAQEHVAVAVNNDTMCIGFPASNKASVYHLIAGTVPRFEWKYDLLPPSQTADDAVMRPKAALSGTERFGAQVYIGDRFLTVGAPGMDSFTTSAGGSSTDRSDGGVGGGTDAGALFVYDSPQYLQALRLRVQAAVAHNSSATVSRADRFPETSGSTGVDTLTNLQYGSDWLAQPASDAARICRVAGPFAGGGFGHSIDMYSANGNSYAMVGAPRANAAIIVRVNHRSLRCTLRERLDGFHKTTETDIGAAVGIEAEMGYYGSPTSSNKALASSAVDGRLYVKGFCLPNRYLIYPPNFAKPHLRTCTNCPIGRYSNGGQELAAACTACPADGRPANADWQLGMGCVWNCRSGYFGSACEPCSVYQQRKGASLPKNAVWVDGRAECTWACSPGFTLDPADTNFETMCQPPPPPPAPEYVLLGEPGPGYVTVVLVPPPLQNNAPLLFARLTVDVKQQDGGYLPLGTAGGYIDVALPGGSVAVPAAMKIEMELAVLGGTGTVPTLDNLLAMQIKPLMADTTYRVRVSLANGGGLGPYSELTNDMITTAASVPSAPLQLAAVNVTSSMVWLQWKLPAYLGGTALTEHRLCIATTSSVPTAPRNSTEVCTRLMPADDSDTMLVANLLSNTVYRFKIQAGNSVGMGEFSDWSDAVTTLDTTLATAPLLPKCTALSGSQVRLSWLPPADRGGEPASYTVARDTNATAVLIAPAAVLNVGRVVETTVTGLLAYTEHVFVIYSHNSKGRSPPSSVVKCSTMAPTLSTAPSSLRVDNIQSSAARLQWTAPEDAGGLPIDNYTVTVWGVEEQSQALSGEVWHMALQGGNSVSATVEGLNASTSYSFSLAANTAVGQSAFSNRTASIRTLVATPPSKPGPPTVVTVSGGTIELEWTPPQNSGGAQQTGCALFRSEDTITYVAAGTTTGAVQRTVVRRLLANTHYFFRVQCSNRAGTGPLSLRSESIKTGPATAPGPLRSLSVRSTESSKVLVQTTAPIDLGGEVPSHVSVQVYNQLLGATVPDISAKVVKADGSDGQLTLDELLVLVYGLNATTAYSLQLSLGNSVGAGPWEPQTGAPELTAQTKAASPPSVTRAIRIVASSSSSIDVEWQAPEDAGGVPLAGFVIQLLYTTDPTGSNGLIPLQNGELPFTMAAGFARQATVRGLNASTTYYVRMYAVNLAGQSPLSGLSSGVATRTASAPSAPVNVEAQPVLADAIEVTWSPPADDGGARVKGYYLFVSQATDKYGTRFEVGRGASVFRVTGLLASTSYYVRLLAFNEGGFGAASGVVGPTITLAQTVPGAPSKPVVTGQSSSFVTVTWGSPTQTGGTDVVEYVVQVEAGGQPFRTMHVGLTLQTQVTGLQANTDIRVTVVAINRVGQGPASVASEPVRTLPAQVPSAPTQIELSAVPGSVYWARWQDPEDLGGGALLGFDVELSVNSQNPSSVVIDDPSIHNISLTVPSSAASTVRVRARNAAGWGAWASSTPRNAALGTVMAGPGSLTVQATTSSSVSLAWSASTPQPAEYRLSLYRFHEIHGDPSRLRPSYLQSQQSVAGDITVLAFKWLPATTSYIATVQALHPSAGYSKPSAFASSATLPATAPDAPVNTTSRATSHQAIAVSWTDAWESGGEAITSYTVQCVEVGSAWPTQLVDVSVARTLPAGVSANGGPQWHIIQLQNLVASTQYHCRVAAVSMADRSSFTEANGGAPVSTWAAAPPSAPEPPLLLLATSSSITAQWSPPMDTGGRPITGYTVQLIRVSDGQVVETKALNNEAVYKFTQLLARTQYTARLTATNAVGTSSPSGRAINIITNTASAPGAPTAITIVTTGSGYIATRWTAPTEKGGVLASEVSVVVQAREVATDRVVSARNVSFADTSVTLYRLTASTQYYIHAYAESVAGRSAGARSVGSTLTQAGSVPTAPLNVRGIGATSSSATFQWQLPMDWGGMPLLEFVVNVTYGGIVPSFPEPDGFQFSARVAAATVTDGVSNMGVMTVRGLSAERPYAARVVAVNAVGMSASSVLSTVVHTLQASTPSGVPAPTVGSPTSSSLQVSWSQPQDLGGVPLTGYDIRVSSDKVNVLFVVKAAAGQQQAHITDLSASTPYFFAVIAANAVGSSTAVPAWSAVLFTSPPMQPTTPALTTPSLKPRAIETEIQGPADLGGMPLMAHTLHAAYAGTLADMCKATSVSATTGLSLAASSSMADATTSAEVRLQIITALAPSVGLNMSTALQDGTAILGDPSRFVQASSSLTRSLNVTALAEDPLLPASLYALRVISVTGRTQPTTCPSTSGNETDTPVPSRRRAVTLEASSRVIPATTSFTATHTGKYGMVVVPAAAYLVDEDPSADIRMASMRTQEHGALDHRRQLAADEVQYFGPCKAPVNSSSFMGGGVLPDSSNGGRLVRVGDAYVTIPFEHEIVPGTAFSSNTSNVMLVITPADVPGPGPTPTMTIRTSSSLEITWRAPQQLETGGCGVRLMHLDGAQQDPVSGQWQSMNVSWTGGGIDYTAIMDMPPTTPSFPLRFQAQNLRRASWFRFRVRSRNSIGWGPWGPDLVIETEPTVPTEPRNVRPVLARFDPITIAIAWDPPLDDGGRAVVSYDVMRRRTEDVGVTDSWKRVTTTSKTEYTDVGLAVETMYTYRILAMTSVGLQSAPSAPRNFSTTAPIPCPSNCTSITGQGTCVPPFGLCSCGRGWKGPDCNTINGLPFTVTMGMSIEDFTQAARTQLETNLAKLIDVAADRLAVVTAQPGSVVATVVIVPDKPVSNTTTAAEQQQEMEVVLDKIFALTNSSMDVLAGAGILSMRHAPTPGRPAVEVGVTAASCDALSCADCTASRSCGWCALESRCTMGTQWGPTAPTGSCTASHHYYHKENGKSCLNECSAISSCSQCSERADCGWCENPTGAPGGQCTRNADIESGAATCANEAGFFRTAALCPSEYCARQRTCSACLADQKCGWCGAQAGVNGLASGTCAAGDAFGFVGSGVGCGILQNYFYGSCDSTCTGHTSCADCTSETSVKCGWCSANSRCALANTTTMDPLGSVCPVLSSYVLDYDPDDPASTTRPPTDPSKSPLDTIDISPLVVPWQTKESEGLCPASISPATICGRQSSCGSCLQHAFCGWCFEPSNPRSSTCRHTRGSSDAGTCPASAVEYDSKCPVSCDGAGGSSSLFSLTSINGSIQLGTAGLGSNLITQVYHGQYCEWRIRPIKTTRSSSGQLTKSAMESVTVHLNYYDLAAGDQLLVYDSAGTSQGPIGVVSGAGTSRSFTSKQGYIELRFNGQSGGGTGFQATYSSDDVAALNSILIIGVVVGTLACVLLCSCLMYKFCCQNQQDEPEEMDLADQAAAAQRLGRGAGQDIIELFPAFVFDTTKVHLTPLKGRDTEDLQCVVCLCEFEQKDHVRVLQCLHAFHKPCIDQWLKLNKTCPLCKGDITIMAATRSSIVDAGGEDPLALGPGVKVVDKEGNEVAVAGEATGPNAGSGGTCNSSTGGTAEGSATAADIAAAAATTTDTAGNPTAGASDVNNNHLNNNQPDSVPGVATRRRWNSGSSASRRRPQAVSNPVHQQQYLDQLQQEARRSTSPRSQAAGSVHTPRAHQSQTEASSAAMGSTSVSQVVSMTITAEGDHISPVNPLFQRPGVAGAADVNNRMHHSYTGHTASSTADDTTVPQLRVNAIQFGRHSQPPSSSRPITAPETSRTTSSARSEASTAGDRNSTTSTGDVHPFQPDHIDTLENPMFVRRNRHD